MGNPTRSSLAAVLRMLPSFKFAALLALGLMLTLVNGSWQVPIGDCSNPGCDNPARQDGRCSNCKSLWKIDCDDPVNDPANGSYQLMFEEVLEPKVAKGRPCKPIQVDRSRDGS